MKKYLFALVFCFTALMSNAQDAPDSLPSVLNPEVKAQFKDGMSGWTRFLERTLNHSLMYNARAPRGAYKVLGNFLIDETGEVKDIRIEQDPGYGAAEEYIRVIRLSGKMKSWIPATDKGKPVAQRHKQAITFIQGI